MTKAFEKMGIMSSLFWKIFHLQLGRYVTPLLGFNIIQFDRDLNTPNNLSCKDFVLEKYGDIGLRMVNELLIK